MALVSLAEHQEISTEWLNKLEAQAAERYPGENHMKALLMTAKDIYECPKRIFFINDDGERVTYADSIKFDAKHASHGRPRYRDVCISPRMFRVLLNPRYHDRPRKQELVRAVEHISEHQWALPFDDVHHFNNFPQEIKEMIFKYVVTVPKDSIIQPHTIECNWKTSYSRPGYQIFSLTPRLDRRGAAFDYAANGEKPDKITCYEDGDLHDGWSETWDRNRDVLTYIKREHQDEHGQYWEVRRCYRPRIDATPLRVCKSMQQYGSKLLYENQVFRFNMLNRAMKQKGSMSSHEAVCHPTRCSPMTLDNHGEIFRPEPIKPILGSTSYMSEIRSGIDLVRKSSSQYDLPGWIFYDPFLRFLHSIGPRNATYLTSLRFIGTILTHVCRQQGYEDREHRRDCEDDDLVKSIRLYIPFIRELCPAVKTVHIEALKDQEFAAPQSHPGWPVTPIPRPTWEECLAPLIADIRSIDSLQKLELELPSTNLPPFAQQAIDFLTRRTWEQRRLAPKIVWDGHLWRDGAETTRQMPAEQLHCGWCGEGHVWAECPNLCNYCGDGRHVRKDCPALSEN